MPLPLLFIGIAATTGSYGVGKTIKAGFDVNNAKTINKDANEIIEGATKQLNAQRKACGNSLNNLGKEKVFVLNNSMKKYVKTFKKIKHIDFKRSRGLKELHKLHVDQAKFVEIESMVNFAGSIAGGAIAGTTGGALAAFGAYSAAQALATASTGTAIASLNGVAATNATLAFFGGGSLAAGGLGMAGGTAVLGGLVAGPAFMVMGIIAGHAAKKDLEKAYTNRAEAIQIATQLDEASLQCESIRRRTYVFFNLLARLDAYFLPLVYKLEEIVATEGRDYRLYSDESKKVVASCASIAVTIKTVLDTPVLKKDGSLTSESEEKALNVQSFLDQLVEQV